MLINYSNLVKIDSNKMFEIYDHWPDIAFESFNKDQIELIHDKFDHIIFVGMGGSGTIGDIFSAILSKENIHVSVVKGYHLPKTVTPNSLVILTSISGNTSETLSVLKLVKKSNYKMAAFSSGGEMEKYCTKNNLNFYKIPLIHSPRSSLMNFLYSMLKILKPIIPIKNHDIKKSLSDLQITKSKISSLNLSDTNPSLQLAKWISGIPVIYYPWGLQAAAFRFKNSLQENAKLHSMCEDIIETSHNGIVPWERKSIVQPILLKGKNDHKKTKERWNIVKDYFQEKNTPFFEIESIENNILSKIVNLIYFTDFTSIYKAILLKQDPSPVKSIDFIKSKFNQKIN
jgi:glucose/mannose-6-phosphate isomerase